MMVYWWALKLIKILVQCNSRDCCGSWQQGQFKKEKELKFSTSSFLRYCQPHKPEKWSGVSQLACLPMFCFCKSTPESSYFRIEVSLSGVVLAGIVKLYRLKNEVGSILWACHPEY